MKPIIKSRLVLNSLGFLLSLPLLVFCAIMDLVKLPVIIICIPFMIYICLINQIKHKDGFEDFLPGLWTLLIMGLIIYYEIFWE
jgi:hypothetical protein